MAVVLCSNAYLGVERMKQDHGVPAILSLVFPGLGQLAKGHWPRALFIWGLMAIAWMTLIVLTMLIYTPSTAAQPAGTERTLETVLAALATPIAPIVLGFIGTVWLWSVVDAYRRPVSAPHSSIAGPVQPPIPPPRPPAPPTPSRDPVQLELPGPGTFPLAIVGESHYQQQLEAVCGGRTEDGVDYRCSALLVLDDANRYDPNAVRVEIDGQHVGHLSRDDAQAYREYLDLHANGPTVGVCRAKVTGGWDRGPDDRGHFGVKLDFALYG